MRVIYVIMFHFLLTCQATAQGWTNLNIPPAGRYDDVFFLHENLGWAINSEGKSYKTTDGGNSWVEHVVSDGDYLRSVEFMDADTGFCGGLIAGKSLFRTTDGGETWVNMTSQVNDLTKGICGLSCPGGKVVYGCGVWSEPAQVIKSLDGGVTWERIDMSPYAIALVDILFIDENTGWVSGRAPLDQGGIILKTIDGGSTWDVVHHTNFPGDYVWKLQRFDDQRWFAAIERDMVAGAKATILKSTDAGLSFQSVQVKNAYERIQAVGFITPEHGWAGDVKLFETTNGGQTWQNINGVQIFGGAFNRFFRMSSSKAFLSGNQLYKYEAASTTSQEPAKIEEVGYHGLKISPNPTMGDVQITVSLRQKTDVILKIYAMNGGFEELLWTGAHEVGDYPMEINLTQKPAGVYVVYLKTHHGTQYALLTKT